MVNSGKKFPPLISSSLPPGRLRLFFAPDAGFFVMFPFAHFRKNASLLALAFKATQSTVERFVLANSDFGQNSTLPSRRRRCQARLYSACRSGVNKLSRRPLQRPASQNVKMQMIYCLSAVRAGIYNNPIALRTQFAAQLSAFFNQRRNQGGIGTCLLEIGVMLYRNYQQVNRRLGIYVLKNQQLLIAIKNIRRRLSPAILQKIHWLIPVTSFTLYIFHILFLNPLIKLKTLPGSVNSLCPFRQL